MTGTNKVAFIPKLGELAYKDLPIPTASDDSIIIKNHLIGINYADIFHFYGILNLTGSDILGFESAGEVIEVGKNVTQFKVGERVVVTTGSTYASYVTVDTTRFKGVAKLPDYISYEDAIGLGLQALTAYTLAFKDYAAQKDDYVLVHAAAGGVGLILVQLLANQGGKVIGTVSSDEKAEFIKKYGATWTIDYTKENIVERVKEITGDQGVHTVIDSVGKSTFNDSISSLRPFGLLVTFGIASGAIEGDLPLTVLQKNLKIHGSAVTNHIKEGDGYNEWWEKLFEELHSGSLKTVITKTYSFDQILEALEDLKGRKTIGKLAIKP